MNNQQMKADILGRLLTARCMLEMLAEEAAPLSKELSEAVDIIKTISYKVDAIGKPTQPPIQQPIQQQSVAAPLPLDPNEPECEACQ